MLLARRLDKLKRLALELKREFGVQVVVARVDISKRASVDAFAHKHRKVLARVKVLINNAGLARGMATLQEGNPDDWDAVIDTNVKGLLYMTHAVLPGMVERGKGHVINLGSVAGFYTYPKGGVYCASKYAVRALSEGLRADLLGTGVRVTEISPGMVETEFSRVRLGNAQKAKAVYQGMRPLNGEDIAEIAVWTASRPEHVNIAEVMVYPTDQASPMLVHRRN